MVVIGGSQYWEPRPGVFIPVICNAACFGGDWRQSVIVTEEMARKFAQRQYGV